MVDRGATTVWESWEGIDEEGRPHDSLNHYSKGAVISFLHNYVAGITLLDGHPAYRRFRVEPRPGGGITWAEAVHDSPYGRIESSWHTDGESLRLTVTAPPGTVAEVVCRTGPVRDQGPGTVTYECGRRAAPSPGSHRVCRALTSRARHADGVRKGGTMSKTAIISVDGHVRASRSDYRNYVEKRFLDAFDAWARAEEEAGCARERQPERGARPDVAVGLGPPPEGHGEPGRRGRGAVPERAALPGEAGGRRGLVLRPRDRPPGPPRLQPLAGRLLRADARPPGRPGPHLVRRRRPGGGGHPLGQGARPRWRHDARPASRRDLLLRPGARPGVGRLRRGRPARSASTVGRARRPTGRRGSPPS